MQPTIRNDGGVSLQETWEYKCMICKFIYYIHNIYIDIDTIYILYTYIIQLGHPTAEGVRGFHSASVPVLGFGNHVTH